MKPSHFWRSRNLNQYCQDKLRTAAPGGKITRGLIILCTTGLIKNEVMQPPILPMQEKMLSELKVLGSASDNMLGAATSDADPPSLHVWDPATERWFDRGGAVSAAAATLAATAGEGTGRGDVAGEAAGVGLAPGGGSPPPVAESQLGRLLQTCVVREGASGDVYAVARVSRRVA